jgi:hypothetical protein
MSAPLGLDTQGEVTSQVAADRETQELIYVDP